MRQGHVCALFLACLLSTAEDATAQPVTATTFFDLLPVTASYPVDGAVLGQGYDLVLGRKLPAICVEVNTAPLSAGDLQSDFQDIYDLDQLFTSLKISASASFGGTGAGASGSVDYAKSVKIEKERRNILSTVTTLRGGTQLVPFAGSVGIALTPYAKRIANESAGIASGSSWWKTPPPADRKAFRRHCGDGYVAAVRTGARLSIVLSYLRDQSEIEESLKASAQGSYGGASAKASVEKQSKEISTSLNNHTKVLQVGGNQSEMPIDVPKTLQKIATFGNYSPEQAVPLELVIVPYRTLVDLPQSLREAPLPDAGVRGLASHYWRLSNLATQYYNASIAPGAYFHPVVDPQLLPSATRALHVATRCTAAMADYCAQNGTCTLEELVNAPSVKDQCDAINQAAYKRGDLTLNEAKAALRLMVGEPPSPGASRGSSKDLVRQESEEARWQAVAKWWQAASVAAKDAPEIPGPSPTEPKQGTGSEKSAPAAGEGPITPYDAYYLFLARAPWARYSTKGSNPLPNDLPSLLASFCTARALNCGMLSTWRNLVGANPPIMANNDDLVAAANIFRIFLASTVLAPMASATCELDRAHPLCQMPDSLPWYLRNLDETPFVLQFGDKRGFYDAPLPPPPPPPAEPRPPRDPCEYKPPGKGGCPPN